MLMRTDPFRDLDRLTQQVFGTAARPAFMPMDAWRSGDVFHIEFDLPGVSTDSIDLDVERNVPTVRGAPAAAPPRPPRLRSAGRPPRLERPRCRAERAHRPRGAGAEQ